MTNIHVEKLGVRLCPATDGTTISLADALTAYRRHWLGAKVTCLQCCSYVRAAAAPVQQESRP